RNMGDAPAGAPALLQRRQLAAAGDRTPPKQPHPLALRQRGLAPGRRPPPGAVDQPAGRPHAGHQERRGLPFNERGRIKSVARVSPRIAPDVISVPQGSWFAPDAKGVDAGASVIPLTSWHPSPLGKGNAQHTTLVEVEKA